jgi:drug/metabolite transporter (DMT)-like permease
MKKPVIGVSSILFATIIWGSAFISQKVAMSHMGPFTFQTARCTLAIIALLLAIAIKDMFSKDGSNFFKRWADKKLWKMLH